MESIKRFLVEGWKAKLVSLFIAISIWYLIKSNLDGTSATSPCRARRCRRRCRNDSILGPSFPPPCRFRFPFPYRGATTRGERTSRRHERRNTAIFRHRRHPGQGERPPTRAGVRGPSRPGRGGCLSRPARRFPDLAGGGHREGHAPVVRHARERHRRRTHLAGHRRAPRRSRPDTGRGPAHARGGRGLRHRHFRLAQPFEDNGIKFFGPDGYKLDDALELEIESLLEGPDKTTWSGPVGRIAALPDAADRYVAFIRASAAADTSSSAGSTSPSMRRTARPRRRARRSCIRSGRALGLPPPSQRDQHQPRLRLHPSRGDRRPGA